jgi:PKD repeat protein
LIQAIKFRPVVLGHYLLTVTPRDVRGEPPRGSVSNGSVFRCAFGSQNLAPVTEGLAADTFFPEINQAVTLLPIAVDPETGVFEFANQSFDFGDGVTASGITGSTSHAYAQSGIYRVRCTVADDQSASATAEDDIFVGSKTPSEFSFRVFKTIPPLEAGVGELGVDTLTATFKGITAKAGDRLVFVYNRNRFGRNSESDPSDDTDIILKTNSFSGSTRLARAVVMTASANSITVQISKASFDSTGDPRFGRADLKGIFKNQRIGLCVYPADGSTPSVFVYTGNIQVKVKGGEVGRFNFVPEESLTGVNTTKEPDPKKQDAQ